MITHRFGGLEIGFVNEYSKPPEGFRLLPGVVHDGDWVMCVRDPVGGNAVEPPTRMHGPFAPSGVGDPAPPDGYRALSRVKPVLYPDLDQLACIRGDHCRAADFVDDHIVLPRCENGEDVFLLPPHEQSITRPPYVLALRTAAEIGQAPVKPRLTNHERPESNPDWKLFRATMVPFPAISDPDRATSWRIAHSPFYKLELWRRYAPVAFLDNQTTQTQHVGGTYATGVIETATETYLASTAITVSAEAGIGIKGINITGSSSVAVTLGYQHAVAVAQLAPGAVTKTIDVPAGHVGAIFAEEHRLVVRRADGSVITGGELVFRANQSFLALQFPTDVNGIETIIKGDEKLSLIIENAEAPTLSAFA